VHKNVDLYTNLNSLNQIAALGIPDGSQGRVYLFYQP
jgi:hypothetical protein